MMTCIFVETSIPMFPTLSLFSFYLNNNNNNESLHSNEWGKKSMKDVNIPPARTLKS